MLHVVHLFCRKMLQRSGKDHAILMVLPSGIYHYKFIVDGECRYSPDLPFVADEMGHVCNLLNVHVCVLLPLFCYRYILLDFCFLFPARPDHSVSGFKKHTKQIYNLACGRTHTHT